MVLAVLVVGFAAGYYVAYKYHAKIAAYNAGPKEPLDK